MTKLFLVVLCALLVCQVAMAQGGGGGGGGKAGGKFIIKLLSRLKPIELLTSLIL